MEPAKQITDWVNAYTGDLLRWALTKTSDQELARDLVQETFLAAVQSLDHFKGQSNPKTWLLSILNHKIADHYRKKTPVRMPDDQAFSQYFDSHGSWLDSARPHPWNSDEEHLLDNEEFNQVLQRCLDALPEGWSLSIKLKYLSEKKGEEICQELGLSTTNYWQIIHRAKLQLRECIENNWS